MAVTVDAASAKITQNTAAARPGLFSNGRLVVCHLTNGFSIDRITPAFTASGEVKVSGPDLEVRGFTFNFIQFQKLRNVSLTYASGELNPERILLTASQPPALTQNPALDSRNAFTPFTSAAAADLRLGKATNGMGDHPASKALATLTHKTSGRQLQLRSFIDSREFWTAWVARSPAGVIQYLAHFHWTLVYQFALEWELADLGGFRLKLVLSSSSVKFDPPIPGPPTAPEIAGMLASPRPPHSNDLMEFAIKTAVLGEPPIRMDLDF